MEERQTPNLQDVDSNPTGRVNKKHVITKSHLDMRCLFLYADIAQLVVHSPCKRDVQSSNLCIGF